MDAALKESARSRFPPRRPLRRSPVRPPLPSGFRLLLQPPAPLEAPIRAPIRGRTPATPGGLQGGTAAGTGMVLTSAGAILTNNHVIDGATRISVQIAGTGRTYAATVVGKDVAEDVAVVQLQGAAGLKVAPFGDSGKVSIGDRVVSLGNALGRAGPPSPSPALVVALRPAITPTDPPPG